MKKWVGSEIEDCDICNKKIEKFFIDGNIAGGGWAIMCRDCHRNLGVGLGIGRGQLYQRINDEWVKIDG